MSQSVKQSLPHFSTSKGDLTTGPVRGHLVRLTLPMIWGLMAVISFQLVDTYYISMLGTQKLAAISYTFPVTYGIFSIFIGMGIAMSSVISRLIGQGQSESVKRVTSHGIGIVFLLSLLVAVIGIPLLDPLFSMMGADETARAMIRSYMVPYFLGAFFVSMPVVGNAALRATGDAVVPAIIMTVAALSNAIFDPLLIFGLYGFPQLDLFGASIATVISNFCAMVAGLIVMYRRRLFDLDHIVNFHGCGDSAKRLLVIALPAGITSMLPAFVNSVINRLLSHDGHAAVAAFGAATRVEAFTMIIMMALSIGLAPVIGQNWGAKKMDRVRAAIRDAMMFSFLWSCLVAVMLSAMARPLAGLFSDDAELLRNLALFFLIVPFSYPLGNLVHGWGSVFNATGQPQISAGLLFTKMIILMIPASIAGHHMAGVTGVFVAIALSNALSGMAFHLWSWGRIKKAP